MRMKTLWISAGTVLVVGSLVLAYWIFDSTQKPSTTGSTTAQSVGLPVIPSVAGNRVQTSASKGASMTVAGIGGAVISTANFIADPETKQDPFNTGYYYLGYHKQVGVQDPTATVATPYVITYIRDTQYFNCTLLQEPIGPVREEMQQYLMTHLGVTQEQMCQLNYMVSVPDRVNSSYSGENLGFSFCPGAVVLPK